MTKILILEDDITLQSAYSTVLKLEGYKTFSASDGSEGLKIAEKEDPDVILLDMLMPNMNGLDFLRAYRAKENHPGVKIIVFSNMSVPSDVREAMDLGASKYLTKSSFTPKEMVQMVEEVMAKSPTEG